MLIGVIAEELLLSMPISVSITETATAIDGSTTGQVVFATLVDDPAAVLDTLDAYLGEIMVEAASAADIASVSSGYEGEISEAITANSTQDGAIASVSNNTWNPADKSASVVLSNGNLSAYASAANQGVRGFVPAATKFYFEVTNSGGFFGTTGVATATANLTTLASNGIGGAAATNNGAVWINNTTSQAALGTIASGDVLCVAVDLTNQRIWFRKNAGSWNNNVSADPATNTGGFNISALFTSAPAYPLAAFSIAGVSKNQVANFGASGFVQTMPSGFSNAQL